MNRFARGDAYEPYGYKYLTPSLGGVLPCCAGITTLTSVHYLQPPQVLKSTDNRCSNRAKDLFRDLPISIQGSTSKTTTLHEHCRTQNNHRKHKEHCEQLYVTRETIYIYVRTFV